jgi:CRP-like cAMP-binding protein
MKPARRQSAPPPVPDQRLKNRLLAALPSQDFMRLRPHLRTIPVAARQTLHKRNEPIREVFFPNGGVASMTMAMRSGDVVEVATIGDEGVIGIGAFFGGAPAPTETMMQVPDGSAEVLTSEAFAAEMKRGGALNEAVGRYSQGLFGLIMQSTACMSLHQVQERCCRWLLMTHDRIRRDQFELSQEFLAMMLGSSRPTVSVVASTLQQAGLIRYTYGRITVTDRQGLEAGACECYATVKDHFDRLGL